MGEPVVALSKHLRTLVEAAGVDPSKYPTPAAIRLAVRRAERTRATSQEVPSSDEIVGGHPAILGLVA